MKSFEVVKNFILDQIRDSPFLPGDKIPSVRDIARTCRVGPQTVSKAVSELVSEGVLTTLHGKGCFVSDYGGNGGGRDTKIRTVGIMANDVRNLYSAGLGAQAFPHLQIKLYDARYHVTLLQCVRSTSYDFPYTSPREIAAQKLAGLATFGIYDLLYLAQLTHVGVPLVALDVDATEVRVDSVHFDHVNSSARMVRTLYELGARRIGFYGGPLEPKNKGDRVYHDPCANERYYGWRAGMIGAGMPPDEDLLLKTDSRSSKNAPQELEAWFARGPVPDAIVTEYPGIVMEFLAKRNGRERPLVAAWTNSAPTSEGPDVYSICDFERMGKVGADLLLQRLGNEAENRVLRQQIDPEVAVAPWAKPVSS